MIIDLVYGTRPNLIKAAALYLAWQEKRDVMPFALRLIDTGQHWDPTLSDGLRVALGLPAPHYRLGIGQAGIDRPAIIAKANAAYCTILRKSPAHATIVIGDVNGSLGIAKAVKSAPNDKMPLIHLEAGLRGGFDAIAEETNRIKIDALCDIHWAPDTSSVENLLAEGGTANHIHQVGNIVIDAMVRFGGQKIEKSSLHKGNRPVLLTLHRAENIDDIVRLSSIIEAIITLSKNTKIIWPLHPRAQDALAQSGLWRRIRDTANIQISAPMLYPAFLSALADCACVITDSGGIIDECAWLGKPGCILRPTTERAATLRASGLRLCEPANLEQTAIDLINNPDPPAPYRPEYWDGKAADRMLQTLMMLAR
ncbi:UDP-N-acetyl glucosamine 2-epimerase [Thalassospira alkalitolerans]|uniref:UDP-N-acetyl glucosamine 2-epimerase n=1 Tax=Thalassospira alkalitolerans TaxID=1293890 RepID=UPI003AA98C69